MNKIISTILDIIALLLIVSIFVMFIAWVIEQIPGRTTSVKEARTVQEEVQEELHFNDTNSNLSSSVRIASQEANSSPILNLLYDIIECESSWSENAVGKLGEIGLAQFKKRTWNWMCGLSGMDLDIYNPQHQMKLLLWALQNNLEHHWTCFNLLTN